MVLLDLKNPKYDTRNYFVCINRQEEFVIKLQFSFAIKFLLRIQNEVLDSVQRNFVIDLFVAYAQTD